MSVRNGLLALLAERPMGAYQLRQEFERRTGATWPLNIGQAYTTLQRLVRDGLAEPAPEQGAGAGEVERFRLTPAGRAEVAGWWANPVPRSTPARDELSIKLALAVTSPGVDVRQVIQAQRTESLRSLHDYTRLKVEAASPRDLAWTLVLDNLVFAVEAEVRWLDHVEAMLARRTPDAGAGHRPDDAETADGAPAARPSDPALRP